MEHPSSIKLITLDHDISTEVSRIKPINAMKVLRLIFLSRPVVPKLFLFVAPLLSI